MTNGLSTEEVVRLLDLAPHPEGGFYRQTFRDSLPVGGPRAASTAIYYLLPGGGISRWHRVDAAEVWHFYAGAPLELKMASQGAPTEVLRLGAALAAGERPQAVVPAGVWQSARSLGQGASEWTLVGCTVAPGFEFAGFELAPADASPDSLP
ncbi:cupin domain-containing protein [Methylocystis sp. SC2]|uniref:cupin domain-containing protein n=1 Tax=Methylocystis sp. (strain SC2) TaxID=187303 RepID=UPI00027AF2A1|nr:cupin domain-containing protein [Methylocystis sp. SC2]CCJ06551.1 Cupin family protein [Methylocystis sp. SC2]